MPRKIGKQLKKPRKRTASRRAEVDPARETAALEVLRDAWLVNLRSPSEQRFDLKFKEALVRQDAEGLLWVTVELRVPALDVDAWLDGTRVDHPDNQPEREPEDAA